MHSKTTCPVLGLPLYPETLRLMDFLVTAPRHGDGAAVTAQKPSRISRFDVEFLSVNLTWEFPTASVLVREETGT